MLRRFGQEPELAEDGALTELQLRIIAESVRSVGLSKLRPRALSAGTRVDNPPDYLQAAALADTPTELLAKISWDSKRVPRALYARFDPKVIEAFLDSKLAVIARKSLEMVPLGSPIDWRMKLPNAPARSALFGLEFLSPLLTFWYQKAHGATSEQISEV